MRGKSTRPPTLITLLHANASLELKHQRVVVLNEDKTQIV